MALLITVGGYAFLKIFNVLSIKHLIKVIRYENDVKLKKFKICDKFEV